MPSFWVDVFYRGAHVDRRTLVSVDGNRAYFPSPKPTRADSDELVGLTKFGYRWQSNLTGGWL